MGDRTSIAWTHRTWNPWHGCVKISPGCKHCYMYTEKKQYGQDPMLVVRSKTKFREPLKWQRELERREAAGLPLDQNLVFTCSWSDWFIDIADAWRDEAYGIIQLAHHMTFQILTKRSNRIAGRFPSGLANVWLGVSVEDRPRLSRIDHLRDVEAFRFLSLEPLLEDLGTLDLRGIGWVIVGGESGPGRRANEVAWVCSIVDQCRAAGVPVFVKQDSALKPGQQGRIPGEYFLQQMPNRGKS